MRNALKSLEKNQLRLSLFHSLGVAKCKESHFKLNLRCGFLNRMTMFVYQVYSILVKGELI